MRSASVLEEWQRPCPSSSPRRLSCSAPAPTASRTSSSPSSPSGTARSPASPRPPRTRGAASAGRSSPSCTCALVFNQRPRDGPGVPAALRAPGSAARHHARAGSLRRRQLRARPDRPHGARPGVGPRGLRPGARGARPARRPACRSIRCCAPSSCICCAPAATSPRSTAAGGVRHAAATRRVPGRGARRPALPSLRAARRARGARGRSRRRPSSPRSPPAAGGSRRSGRSRTRRARVTDGAAGRARRRARCARARFSRRARLIPLHPSASFRAPSREGSIRVARAAWRRRGRARPARRPSHRSAKPSGAVKDRPSLRLRVRRRQGRRPRRHEEPARRQGRQPGRDGPPRPARAARLHDLHRRLHLLLRPRPALSGRAEEARSPTRSRRSRRPLGKRFGDPDNPLLVSVRSGARASMPGMMDTILNLGLNDQTVAGLIARDRQRALRLRLLPPLRADVRRRRPRPEAAVEDRGAIRSRSRSQRRSASAASRSTPS